MNILSLVATMLGLALAAAAVYMYFTGHFALNTMLAIAGSGLYFFSYALTVLLRASKPIDAKDNTYSPTASFTPPSNY